MSDAATAPGTNDTQDNAQWGNIAADRLRSLIERIERLEEERKALSSDIKDIYAESKSAGLRTLPRTVLTISSQYLRASTQVEPSYYVAFIPRVSTMTEMHSWRAAA